MAEEKKPEEIKTEGAVEEVKTENAAEEVKTSEEVKKAMVLLIKMTLVNLVRNLLRIVNKQLPQWIILKETNKERK